MSAKWPIPKYIGGVPERPKGTDCKSVGEAFGGSNPPPSTNTLTWRGPMRGRQAFFILSLSSGTAARERLKADTSWIVTFFYDCLTTLSSSMISLCYHKVGALKGCNLRASCKRPLYAPRGIHPLKGHEALGYDCSNGWAASLHDVFLRE